LLCTSSPRTHVGKRLVVNDPRLTLRLAELHLRLLF
jgi:hypothetical protein